MTTNLHQSTWARDYITSKFALHHGACTCKDPSTAFAITVTTTKVIDHRRLTKAFVRNLSFRKCNPLMTIRCHCQPPSFTLAKLPKNMLFRMLLKGLTHPSIPKTAASTSVGGAHIGKCTNVMKCIFRVIGRVIIAHKEL
jgi:hypothetical protein